MLGLKLNHVSKRGHRASNDSWFVSSVWHRDAIWWHIDPCQHWLRQWLVAWQHQTITLTKVYVSSKLFNDTFTFEQFLKKCSWTAICNMCSEITFLILLPDLTGTNELNTLTWRLNVFREMILNLSTQCCNWVIGWLEYFIFMNILGSRETSTRLRIWPPWIQVMVCPLFTHYTWIAF